MKNRSNILASILQSPDVLRDAYQSSVNDSAGSAEKELAAYLDSIDGKISRFQNEVQEFWYNLISSETVKNVIDFGTWIMDFLGNLVDKLGEVGTIVTALGAGIGIKKLFSDKNSGGILKDLFGVGLKDIILDLLKLNNTTNKLGETEEVAEKATVLLSKNFVKLGESVSYTTKSIGKLLITTPVGWAIMTVGAITALVGIYDALTVSVEEAKEALDNIKEENEEVISNFESQKKLVDKVSDRYSELSESVSRIDNSNISLSTEEYEEFLGINEQLASLFPELITGFDEEGNAILNLGGDALSTAEDLQILLEKEEELKNFKLAENLPDMFKNSKVIIDDYEKTINSLVSQIKNAEGILISVNKMSEEGINFDKNNSYQFEYNPNDNAAQKYQNALYKAVQNFAKENKLDINSLYSFGDTGYLDENGDAIYYALLNAFSLTEEQRNYLQVAIQEEMRATSGYLKDYLGELNGELKTSQVGQDNVWADLQSIIVAEMKTKQTFKDLDDASKNLAEHLVNSLDHSVMAKMDSNSTYEYIRENIIDPLSTVPNEYKLKLTDLFSGELLPQDMSHLAYELQSYFDANGIDIDLNFVIKDSQDNVQEYAQTLAQSAARFSGESATSKYSGKYFSDYDDLEKFAKDNNIKTKAEQDFWLQCLQDSKTAEEAKKKYLNQNASFVEATNLSFVEIQSNIQNLSKGLDQLGTIYEDISNKEDFDWSSILNNESFTTEFGNLTNASEGYKNVYDEFIETISNSPDDIDACQEAFNRLATAYIQSSDALKGVTEETKNASVAQLEQMGISNAEEIVDYYIIKEKAAQLGVDFATATADDIRMLINEGIVAGETAQALLNYQLQKALANSNSLSTAEDCRQMYELAVKCGATSEVLQDLIKLRQIYETLADSSLGLSQFDMNNLLAEANALQSSIKKQVEGFESSYEPVATYTRGLKSAKDASDAAKDATDALKEAIEAEIDALEKQKEALEESLNELDELYDAIQWVLDGKIEDIDDIIEKIQEENDALAEQKEIYDNILSVVDSVYNAEIEAIQEKIDALGEENEEQEKALALEEARRKVEELRKNNTILQYTEDNGYVYVRDEAALKEAEDDFAEKSKELEESKIKKELEDQIELLEKYRDMWGEIPDAFEKSMNEIEAMKHFGTDWKNAILNSDEGTIGEFQGNYTGLQENEKANEDKISYYEEEKKKIEDLKELWEDAKNAYIDNEYKAKLASFFGSDYEYQILNNSLTWRTRFTDEYCSLQMQIADIEEKIKALNEQSANIIADSATKVSNALNKTTEAVNGLKSSLSTEGSGGSNILSGVEASVDKSLLQIESLKLALSDLDLARKTLEETIDAEIVDTSKLVGETQTKVQEISIAISSLLLSVRLLRINIEELLTALLNINDTVTLDRVISLIGSGAEGSLLGAINSVIEKLSDANGGLLYELSQLNGKQLDFIIAEFNGDDGLLSAIKEVSSAILSSEDDECLVTKINSLTETIDSINTVKDSFELLETKVGNCVDKVTTLNEKIQGLQDKTITITVEVARHTTVTVDTAIGTEDIPTGIEIDNTELDDILATMPHGYAKGGIVGKKDESILDPYAESLGEHHMVAARNGEAIIPVNTVKANPELVSGLLDADGKSISLSDKGISYKIAGNSFNRSGNTFTPVNVPNLFGSAISGFNLDKVAPKYENKMNPESYVNTVSNENSVSITIGDIHLSGVQDVNGLSNAIINKLPNTLIQALGRI